MAQSVSSTLSVAITRDGKEYLTRDESDKIHEAILKQIISEACSTKQDKEDSKIVRPIFNREPELKNGALNMWCEDDQTLAWLKHTVSMYDPSLVIKSQSEIQTRHSCEIIFFDKLSVIDASNIESILSLQNPWIDFKRWEIKELKRHVTSYTFLMSIPEDQVLCLMKAERLSVGLTMANVKFQNFQGYYNLNAPYGWDHEKKQFRKKNISNKQ